MQTATTPQLSVIIPTYNRSRILRLVLLALAEQTVDPATFEVLVVDDASDDDTQSMLAELHPPYSLRVITLPQRTGPAGARNAGIRAAWADLILFLDSDLVPAPELVEAHMAAHRGHDRCIGHGAVIHTTDIENPTSAEMKVTDVSRAFFATGNASIRREHLVRAGLFDEDFREYGWEDLELGLRLRRLGLTAVRVPQARGYHYKAKLRLDQLPGLLERERQRARTAAIYYSKHPLTRVRYSIMLSPVVFYLDRLMNVANWMERPGTLRLLQRVEASGRHMLLRFLVRLVTHHAYMAELRRAFPPGSVGGRFVR